MSETWTSVSMVEANNVIDGITGLYGDRVANQSLVEEIHSELFNQGYRAHITLQSYRIVVDRVEKRGFDIYCQCHPNEEFKPQCLECVPLLCP